MSVIRQNSMHRLLCIYATFIIVVKFTDEQYAIINQSIAGLFDPRVFINCLQVVTCKQLTTRMDVFGCVGLCMGLKRPVSLFMYMSQLNRIVRELVYEHAWVTALHS